jgi:3-hydroxyisobutyrate dehydrogenase-like beta-hydroxyacid dehydrogenase
MATIAIVGFGDMGEQMATSSIALRTNDYQEGRTP